MMFAGDDDVFHAGGLGEPDPGAGVELDGVKLVGEAFVLGDGHAGLFEEPLAVVGIALPFAGRHGVNAPVNEQTKASRVEPRHATGLGLGRFLRVIPGLKAGRPQPAAACEGQHDPEVAQMHRFHGELVLVSLDAFAFLGAMAGPVRPARPPASALDG